MKKVSLRFLVLKRSHEFHLHDVKGPFGGTTQRRAHSDQGGMEWRYGTIAPRMDVFRTSLSFSLRPSA